MTKAQRVEQAEAIDKLREMIKPGDTVRTILRHVSRSGMQRAITLVIEDRDADSVRVGDGIHSIDWLAARALGDRIDPNHGAIVVGGCGMDMGFNVVYNLSLTLWPEYDCIEQGDANHRGDGSCPSPDHVNHGDCEITRGGER